VAQAWLTYKQSNVTSGSTNLNVLAPYLNYVKMYTSGSHGDEGVGAGDMACDNTSPCYQLASGATIKLEGGFSFGGTASTNAVDFMVDPDGTASGITTGPGKGVEFALYYNGRLSTVGTLAPGTQFSGGAYLNCPSCDPSWFTW
jgi:hypothetical protein